MKKFIKKTTIFIMLIMGTIVGVIGLSCESLVSVGRHIINNVRYNVYRAFHATEPEPDWGFIRGIPYILMMDYRVIKGYVCGIWRD